MPVRCPMKEVAFTQMGRPPNTRHDYCCKIAISNNVGGVEHFSSSLCPALREERHFALVEELPIQPKLARNQHSSLELSPTQPSLRSFTAIMMAVRTPREGGGTPNQLLAHYEAPTPASRSGQPLRLMCALAMCSFLTPVSDTRT